jgi:hypothetical protein
MSFPERAPNLLRESRSSSADLRAAKTSKSEIGDEMLQRTSVHKPDVAPSLIARLVRRCGGWPAIALFLLSLSFGSAVIVVDPPLRGPDEISHFLRIYSYTRGEVLPTTEVNGHRGVFVERALYDQLRFLKDSGERFAKFLQQRKGIWFTDPSAERVRYGEIMAEYEDFTRAIANEARLGAAFAPFAGTEGYSPVAYAPYILAAAIGHALSFDLPEMLLLMRLLGLVMFTAVVAYAVAVTPTLKWAFVLIAMLPVSLYNRTVLSADGAALSYAMVITALCLRAAWNPSASRVWERSLWMTLCALAKPPQIVFAVMELMVGRSKELPQRLRSFAIVVLPAIILSPLWVAGVSADVAAWRVWEGHDYPPQQFNPLWKLAYMWEHPFHFPLAAWAAVRDWGAPLWPELIGILGWQDILLRPWTYLVLTVLLLLVPLQKLPLDGPTRAWVAVITGLVSIGYVTLVYLIFFITYTPIASPHVLGVQGRYFVIILPAAAIFLAALINLELPRRIPAFISVAGSLVSGATTLDAILHAHW